MIVRFDYIRQAQNVETGFVEIDVADVSDMDEIRSKLATGSFVRHLPLSRHNEDIEWGFTPVAQSGIPKITEVRIDG